MRIALLEPYYGGSHAAFCDTFVRHSRHDVTLVTMPARKWKWRMRGAALWWAREETAWLDPPPDLVLCNDMVSVADLRALLPPSSRPRPIACYFHENQLTYPLPHDQVRDFQYGMTNITSALAAEAVWFNSRFHLENFLEAAQTLLAKMPDYLPGGICEAIRNKATVLYPPVELPEPNPPRDPDRPLTILWPHRWEFDKNPEPFFAALIRLAQEGRAFRLVVLGEQFRAAPAVFENSWDTLRSHLHHAGFIENRNAYREMLASCDVVVSTAVQENFGIAVVEAMLAGCQPLLPHRLVYPELIPAALLERCLYEGDGTLVAALRKVLEGAGRLSTAERAQLRSSVAKRFGAPRRVAALDDASEALRRSFQSRDRLPVRDRTQTG